MKIDITNTPTIDAKNRAKEEGLQRVEDDFWKQIERYMKMTKRTNAADYLPDLKSALLLAARRYTKVYNKHYYKD